MRGAELRRAGVASDCQEGVQGGVCYRPVGNDFSLFFFSQCKS